MKKRGPRDLTCPSVPPAFSSGSYPKASTGYRASRILGSDEVASGRFQHRAGLNRRITGRSRRAIVGLALLLAACQTPTVVKDHIVEVDKPVATQPIKPADIPAVPAPLPPRPKDLSAAADVLLAKVCEWVAFGIKADPLLRVSAGVKQEALARYPECER